MADVAVDDTFQKGEQWTPIRIPESGAVNHLHDSARCDVFGYKLCDECSRLNKTGADLYPTAILAENSDSAAFPFLQA